MPTYAVVNGENPGPVQHPAITLVDTNGAPWTASSSIPAGTYAAVPTSGTLAARPAVPAKGDYYLATDTGGGTLYSALTAGAWTQVAAGITAAPAAHALRGSLHTDALRPTAALAETVTRVGELGTAHALVSGRLDLVGIILPSGLTVTSISFVSSAGATTPTNQWFALFDNAATPALLRQTADNTTTAWAGSTIRTLALTSSFVTTYTGLHYLGIMVAAATPTTLMAALGLNTINGLPPILAGFSTASLTTPASFTSPAIALTAGNRIPYAYVS